MLPFNINHFSMMSIFFQVLLICNINQSHWIACKINLKEWVIYIYDSIAHRTKDMSEIRENDIMSMRRLLPKVMNKGKYFERARLPTKKDTFKAVRVDHQCLTIQDDGASCGMFCLYFLDQIVKGSPLNTITQDNIPRLRKETALSVFANSILIDTWSMLNLVNNKHIWLLLFIYIYWESVINSFISVINQNHSLFRIIN